MKNSINILFSIILGLIILITFWTYISPNKLDDRVCINDYDPAGTSIWYPLGCDEFKHDFAVHLSEAFQYNIKISILGSLIFLIIGIVIGLSKGLIVENTYVKRSYFNKPIYIFKDIIDYVTDLFLSVPILLVLIFSSIFFQYHISDPNSRLTFIIIILACFSSPQLSLPLEGIVKKLNKEEFILAAKASGISKFSLIFKHILYYESKGLIIIQTINFFLFSIMMEIFLTFVKKGSDPYQPSLGTMVNKYKGLLVDVYQNPQLLEFQEFVLTLTPFIFIILLCLTVRWLGQRIRIITEV